MTKTADEIQTAKANWYRFEYGRNRGHREYCKNAQILEGMYLGGGLQWSEEDRQALKEAGKPAFEFNQIMPKINTALGYQIGNRADIAYRARNVMTDDGLAEVMTKLVMQIADNTGLHWHESQVFADGMIQQRGFYEVYVSYEDTILGELALRVLDPLDVIPDPDAKGYDPDEWSDVTISRWMTYDEIEQTYGREARAKLEVEGDDEEDHGDDTEDEGRNKFGDGNTGYGNQFECVTQEDGIKRVRVIDRQYWKMVQAECLITQTGDIRVIEGLPEERRQAMLAAGGVAVKRRTKRVRWTITTARHVLFDDWSPFAHFTVVPFFPYFRRGKTRGAVDNAIGPQQMLNKSLSQFLHVVNTTSNSGWITWANTINNMRADELEERGAETGLHIELKKETSQEQMPRKIQPNQVPQGLDRIVERSAVLLEQAMGINEAMMGNRGPETSGIAIQARQHAAQQQLAVPLDNLARTRNILARRILDIIQAFYDMPRIARITKPNMAGKDEHEDLLLNWPDGDSVMNDLTVGEYDVVISEQPIQVTFDNSQFVQALELMERGAPIPWPFVLRYSNLTHKQDIIEAMESMNQPDPLMEAKVELTQAQAKKANSESVTRAVESLYSAMQAANVIATTPQTAPLADAMLKSAGFVDQDQAPIVPQYEGAGPVAEVAPEAPTNYDPRTPPSPTQGVRAGIRTPENDGVM